MVFGSGLAPVVFRTFGYLGNYSIRCETGL